MRQEKDAGYERADPEDAEKNGKREMDGSLVRESRVEHERQH